MKIKFEKLLPVIPRCLGIPSLAPKDYRAFSFFTPGRAYHQLLRLKNKVLNGLELPNQHNNHSIKKDELVHFKNSMELFPEAVEYTSDANLYNHYLFLPLTTKVDVEFLKTFFLNQISIPRPKVSPLDREVTQEHHLEKILYL